MPVLCVNMATFYSLIAKEHSVFNGILFINNFLVLKFMIGIRHCHLTLDVEIVFKILQHGNFAYFIS